MRHYLRVISAAACAAGLTSFGAFGAPAQTPLSLEKIMADPDWIGPPVSDAYWSADAKAVYYSLKRIGSPIADLHRIDASNGKDQVVDAAAMANADGPAVYDRAGRRAAFIRNRDIFVRDLASGRLTQITRTPQPKSHPHFSLDGRLLSFRIEHDWFVHDLGSGVTTPAAIVKAEKDPDAPPAADDLREMQLRTFSTLKKLHDDKETLRTHNEALQKGRSDARRAAFLPGRRGAHSRYRTVARCALAAGRDRSEIPCEGAGRATHALCHGIRLRGIRKGAVARRAQPARAAILDAAQSHRPHDARACARETARDLRRSVEGRARGERQGAPAGQPACLRRRPRAAKRRMAA